jgi:hypothetical protein
MLQGLRRAWSKWRESRRQYQIERAVFKASGGMEQYAHHRDGDLSQITGSAGGADAAGGTASGGL